jgi:hypothetical protein
MCFTDYGSPEFCTTAIHTARKPHKCSECGDTIAPGTLYEYVSGSWGEGLDVFKICPRCVTLWQAIHDDEIASGCREWESWPPYGGLWECAGEYVPPFCPGTTEEGIEILRRRKAEA